MKLTEKDKTLLLILGIVIILFFPFYFIVRPFSDMSDTLETEIVELEDRKRELEDLAFRKEEFIESIDTATAEKNLLLLQFPAEVPQEKTILFLDNTEKLIPFTLSQTSFEEQILLPITGSDEQSDNLSSGETTEVSDSAATEAASVEEELTGIYNESMILYSGGYRNFKDFLNYILNYKNRMVISSLTAIYSSELDIVAGNLTLREYGIAGNDREAEKIKEPMLLEGTSNVFMQATGIVPSGAEDGAADFFLMLSQPEADGEAVIFGQSMDGTRDTYLTSNTNDLQEVAISFRGNEGSYVANYQIGDVKYSDSGEGISFDKEGNIVFEVISSERVGESDKVGVRLSVINKTDRMVNVTVINEDKEEPRVTITGKTGEVTVK